MINMQNLLNVLNSWLPTSPREWVLYVTIFVLLLVLFLFYKGLMKCKELQEELAKENRNLRQVCENHGFDIKFAEVFGDMNG